MKKILLCFFMTLFSIVTMSAQNLEKSKFFDNTFVSLSTGVSGYLHPTCNSFDNFGNSVRSLSAIRFGKMATPIFGFEVEIESGMADVIKFIDHTTIGGNFLFNVNNIVHPYRGVADKFEFVPLVGVGWRHTFGAISNNIISKFGLQINHNFGNEKEWQFNVIPSINYIMTDGKMSEFPTGQPRFDACRSFLNLQVGFTYRFKNHDGNRNFTISKLTRTQDEVDNLMNQVNEQRSLLKEKDEELAKKEAIIKILNERNEKAVVTEKVKLNIPITIGFEIGQSEINETQRANLIQTAKLIKDNNLKVKIVGHSDKETGTPKRNMILSEHRAKSVADALSKLGVENDKIDVKWFGDTNQLFEENDANRVVIFVTE